MYDLFKTPTSTNIYVAFQEVQDLVWMFSSSSKNHKIGSLVFTRVSGDAHEPLEDTVSKEERFSVWKTGELFVKLTGYVTSYGEYDLVSWKFVQPLEKTVVVYE